MEYKFEYQKPINYTSAGSVPKTIYSDIAEEENNKIPILFTPIKIKNMELKNRFVVSPMCQYSSKDGYFNDFHFGHYTSFAKGGSGLIVIEATGVVPEGRITYGCTGLWKDSQIEGLKRIVDFSHEFDAKVGIQLAHAGRKASNEVPYLDGSKNSHLTIPFDHPSGNGWKVYGASPIPWNEVMAVPIEMTIQDIENVIESFKLAAERCIKAGLDFIEIHGAHGYLISSFLSTTSNKRTDSYGGSFEGRIKLLIEVVKAVRSVWTTEKPLAVRISADECVREADGITESPLNGWGINDSIKLASVLEQYDVDLLDPSSGGNNKLQNIKPVPLYHVPYSSAIKNSIKERSGKLLVSAVGLIDNAENSESILQSGSADLIFLGRPYLRNPFLPVEFAKQLNLKIDYAPQYQHARNSSLLYSSK
ncbi:hypothetical protein ACTFIY_008627 [Dictyostelium cf. discoideum]